MDRVISESDFYGNPVAAHVPRGLVREVDLFHGEGMESDPFVVVNRLHREPRLIYNIRNPEHGQSWMPTRAADIRYILGEPKIFSSQDQAGFSALLGETWRLGAVEMDAPQHTKFRHLINQWVSPAQVAKLGVAVRKRAVQLIDAVLADGKCEFMSSFGINFPISIFMDLMGLPHEQKDEFLDWAGRLLHSSDYAVKVEAAKAIRDYLLELMADRRRSPRDDIASWTVQATFEGVPLTDDEVMGIYFVLFTGGLDTVAASLGFHFWHLATHPEVQQSLREHPEKIPAAVEEYLRMYSPVQSQRCVTEDVYIGDVELKKGDWITILHALASRDPLEFVNPETVDFARKNNRHFAFAYGPHFCVGAHLARRELQIAVEEWTTRVPPFRIAEGATVPTRGGTIFGVNRLEITWKPETELVQQ